MKRRFLKEKEARKLLSEFFERTKLISERLPELKPPIEVVKADDAELFLIRNQPVFVKAGNEILPTLFSEQLLSKLPVAVVNMGAVPYVCNGADIMAPGIVRFEGSFDKEDIVVVVDERHQKPIAVATALYSSREAEKLERGKVLRNNHYVGDKLWNLTKS